MSAGKDLVAKGRSVVAFWSQERTVRVVLGVLLVVSAAGWISAKTTIAQGNPDAAAIKNPVPSSAESIDAGKRLYQRHCASCHGANAEGGAGNDLIPAAPDLTDKEWKHGGSDGEIFSAIKNGIPPDLNMVPFGDQLKDQEIWSVVNYIRSLAKK
jgi:cbb3-type cytochrome c oxidase subunit III